MIIIPDKLRRPAEVERDELRKHLAEAQAEIENLKWRINSEEAKAEAALELNGKAIELFNEARTDAEHWKSECNALQRRVHEARAEIKLKNEELDMFLAEQQAMGEIIERKGKLIEQMREALKAIDGIGREAGNARREDALRCFAIAAAALAAERGEK
jgi:chromosome segregation ATPase